MTDTSAERTRDRALLRRVAREVRPHWRGVAGIFLVDLAATPILLLMPVPLKIAVDSVIGSKPLPSPLAAFTPGWLTRSNGSVLGLVAGLLLAVVVLNLLQQAAAFVLRARTTERLTLAFRARLFRHAQRLSLAFHDVRGSTDSIYRIQYDATAIQSMTVDGVIPLVTSTIALVSMLYVTAKIDMPLALVALTVAPVLFVLSRSYKVRARRWYRNAKELESSAFGVVQEALTALRVVKAFGREEHEHLRFVGRSRLGVDAKVRIAAADSVFGGLIDLTTALGTAAVLVIGVRGVQSGRITLGELLLVMAYLTQLYGPLKTMSRTIGTLQSSLASAERTFELLDESPDVPERPHARPLERAAGRLEFRDVGFAYAGNPPVLHGVSFSLDPGASLGIAGPTGAGKTTLISLVTRLYDPTGGAILLDGVDLRDLRLADLRNQFAIVLQEPVLFSASIAENIAYARPDAGEDEIVAAAQAASAHSFIVGLPEGYATHVGERGMRLSGGERQRISLARAFLKDAPILVLDEPTSSVDVATERLIMAAMRRLMVGRTTLMIAHRLSTLEECDRRLEIDHGRIVALSTTATRAAPRRSPNGARGTRRATSTPEAVDEHPAATAWRRLDLGPPPESIEVVRTPQGRRVWKSQVYRLRGAGPNRENVIAKQAGLEGIRVEHRVYEEVLPRVLLATIGCYGWIEDPAGEAGWLFLEDAEGVPYADDVADHRRLAGEWLGALHLRTARLDLADRLPDRGTSWYLFKLRAARRRIGESLQNPALSDEAIASLQRVIEQTEVLEAAWDDLDRFGRRFPPVLAHGDFTSKNVLVSAPSSGRRLSVMDWGTAGWGVPASDAAAADLASYGRTIGASWGQISSTEWRALGAMGTILRLILWMEAETCALSSPWVERPVRKLEYCRLGLADALGDLASGGRSIS